MEWQVREITAVDTHNLRRVVSANGRTDLQSMHQNLDDTAGAWHLGAVDESDLVVAISSFYLDHYPLKPDVPHAVQLAVDPAVQRRGIGSAVMTEAIRRLKATDATLLWANARDKAVPFYRRFGFTVAPDTAITPQPTGRPHHLIELELI